MSSKSLLVVALLLAFVLQISSGRVAKESTASENKDAKVTDEANAVGDEKYGGYGGYHGGGGYGGYHGSGGYGGYHGGGGYGGGHGGYGGGHGGYGGYGGHHGGYGGGGHHYCGPHGCSEVEKEGEAQTKN